MGTGRLGIAGCGTTRFRCSSDDSGMINKIAEYKESLPVGINKYKARTDTVLKQVTQQLNKLVNVFSVSLLIFFEVVHDTQLQIVLQI